MAPTMTVPVQPAMSSEPSSATMAVISRTWRDRVIRPITEEEENYELLRVQRNAKSNLKMKGKQSVQLSRRNGKSYNSYDQI